MIVKSLTMATLVSTILIPSASLNAQTPPAETYQPGFWQPVARVDINRPIQLQFVNQTGQELEYALTTNQAPPRQLLPQSVAVLREIPIPANVLVNAKSPLTNLKYAVTVADNVVTVTIRQVNGETPGDNSLSINETGGIYIY